MNHIFGAQSTDALPVSVDAASGLATIDLPRVVRETLRIRFERLPYAPDDSDCMVRIGRSLSEASALHGLKCLFDDLRMGKFSPTALVIRGMPNDGASAAPAPGEDPATSKSGHMSEFSLLMAGASLGEPYTIREEGTRLINDLIPLAEDRNALTGLGSERRLGFHIENAALRWKIPDRDLSPHSLLLCGVASPQRSAPRTLLANGRLAAAALSRSDYAVLREPCVRLGLPIRQRTVGADFRLPASPVISGMTSQETITAALYGDMTLALTPTAKRALAAFEDSLERVSCAVLVEPGCLVYIPNKYTLHARDAFVPEFDAAGRANRWLQRIFVTHHLDWFDQSQANISRVFRLSCA